MAKQRWISLLHRWVGLLFFVILLYVCVSGIILNHPELIAEMDAPIWLLPGHMRLQNWNRGAILAAIPDDTGGKAGYLLGGKLGILRLDEKGRVSPQDDGLPQSLYRRRVNVLHRDPANGDVYAGGVFGLYRREPGRKVWTQVQGVSGDIRSLIKAGGILYGIGGSRAYRVEGGEAVEVSFGRTGPGSDKHPFFSYLFHLHDGRVLGLPGRLLADMAGLVLILLALSGLTMWVFPKRIRVHSKAGKRVVSTTHRYHFFHYRKLGFVLLLPLFSIPLTGLFMQPPFLIAVARLRTTARLQVAPPPRGGWNDAVDRVAVDPEREKIYVIAGARVYEGPWDFSEPFTSIDGSLPIHPMGATVFEKQDAGRFLIGSFSGLTLWDARENQFYSAGSRDPGRPLSRRPVFRIPDDGYQVNGLIRINGREAILDFHRGLLDRETGTPVIPMPQEYRSRSVFSIWHFMFEIHNGRIWSGLVGGFYILHTMTVSLTTLAILWTGLHISLSRARRRDSRARPTRDASES